MNLVKKSLVIALVLVAGVAVAKEGVQDPVVKARMELMDINGANAKILGEMAGGKMAFDAAKAEAAKAALIEVAKNAPTAFEANATDPVSEAKPDIWTNWADFVTKADALKTAAEKLDASSVEGLAAGMGAVGGACKNCHSTYRM